MELILQSQINYRSSIARTLLDLNWLLVFGSKSVYKWSGCLALADLYAKVELFTKEAKHEMENKATCGYFLTYGYTKSFESSKDKLMITKLTCSEEMDSAALLLSDKASLSWPSKLSIFCRKQTLNGAKVQLYTKYIVKIKNITFFQWNKRKYEYSQAKMLKDTHIPFDV